MFACDSDGDRSVRGLPPRAVRLRSKVTSSKQRSIQVTHVCSQRSLITSAAGSEQRCKAQTPAKVAAAQAAARKRFQTRWVAQRRMSLRSSSHLFIDENEHVCPARVLAQK
jgi:hypothetical protein